MNIVKHKIEFLNSCQFSILLAYQITNRRGLQCQKGKINQSTKKVTVPAKTGNVLVYASPKVSDALKEVLQEMTLYKGVRLSQVIEAVYIQGKKDGAKNAFLTLDAKVLEAKKKVPHKNPGRPKK